MIDNCEVSFYVFTSHRHPQVRLQNIRGTNSGSTKSFDVFCLNQSDFLDSDEFFLTLIRQEQAQLVQL